MSTKLSESYEYSFEKSHVFKNSYISLHFLQMTPTLCEVSENGKALGFSSSDVSMALVFFLDPLGGIILHL
jgi:hypothetical protein